MEGKVKVFIVEDHQLFREGLKSLLARKENLEVVGEAEDGLKAVSGIRKKQPDLVLLDLSMPRMSGISVIKEARRLFPDIKILSLTIHETDQYVLEAFEAGTNGYCVKDASREELMMAIESTLEGKTYISPGIATTVLQGFLEGRQTIKDKSTWETVTQREREILKLLAEGYKNKEIADLLNISIKTVETHRSNIMNKLDLHNVAALTAFAIDKGLVEQK